MTFEAYILPHVQDRITCCRQAYEDAIKYRYSDPEIYTSKLNKFYLDEIVRRAELAQSVKGNPGKMKQVLSMMSRRENIINTMVDWTWTYDPRLAPLGLPTTLPWIPWQQQVDFIEWTYNLYLNQGRQCGIVEKSRDCGVTWLVCLIELQEWRWINGFAGGIGSNKWDSVDKRDDPDAIFEKLRSLLKNYPSWWFPKGWDWKKHNKLANLVNPENNAQIAGQGGKEIGRGGRRAFYLCDEKASFETPEAADSALSQTTSFQLDVSTPCGMNSFGTKRWSGKHPVFTFTWKKDPRKNEEWYAHQVASFRPEIVAQEVDLDYLASVERIAILPKWVEAAVNLKLDWKGPRSAGLDVAAGGKNKSALAIRGGPYVKVQSWNMDNAVDLVHTAIDLCNSAKVEILHYDKPGVGHAVTSTISRTERTMSFQNYGWEPGGSPSDRFYEEFGKPAREIFINQRAEAWYNLALRFEKTWQHVNGIRQYDHSELISIEDDPKLRMQLSSPKKIPTETGKVKIESKEAMLTRGIESPDEADAVVMAFLEPDGGYKHVLSSYLTVGAIHVPFKIDDIQHHRVEHLHYGGFVLNDNMSVDVLMAIWDTHYCKLWVYDEYHNDFANPSEIVPRISYKMRLKTYSLTKMIANDECFSEGSKDFAKSMKKAFQDDCGQYQFVKLRPPKKYDPYGSVAITNDLIIKKRITVHTNCVNACRELSTWKLEKGYVKETGMRQALLLIVSELEKRISLKEVLSVKSYYREADIGKPRVVRTLVEDDDGEN